jgi:predicted Zn finger-like uncharacterized protein
MKIVCEACQAKYSIADDKVRGKVFKIRCKKCSHVIVVRGSGEVATAGGPSNEFAAAPTSSPDLALDAGWHIVVDGEQVGPLSEADVRARLSRSEITPDTYIWREGLADWVKISTLPEFAGDSGTPFPEAGGEANPFGSDGPTAVAPNSADPFSAGGGGGGGGGVPAIAELFAAPLPGQDNATTTVSSSPGFGQFDPYSASEAVARSGGGGNGNGAMGVGMVQPSGLTGQRHENSVLFSLANLESLAKPAPASMPLHRSGAAPVSTSTTTEGSGLIDIRAMANMTLGGSAKSDMKSDDLPAFSAPQFSPVAPVLLPMGSTGTPRWAIAVLSVLGLAIVALGVVVVKIFMSPQAPPVVVQAPPPAPTPTEAPKAPPPTSAQPPATPPPTANENLPPREPAATRPSSGATASAGEGAAADRPGGRARPGGRRPGAAGRNAPGAAVDRGAAPAPPPPAPRPVAEAPRKPKDDIEALLEAASGNRRSPPPARREAEEPVVRTPAAEKAPPLDREEIVKGMNAVMPRARECYNQYKVPGVATVKITVSPAGRVSGASVTGRFAGTPSGTCVEAALKTARFPPSAGRSFDYVVPLR